MKITVWFLLLIFISCKKNKDIIRISSRAQLENIREPLFFRDSLGLGELSVETKISEIKRYSYGWDNYYYFDYYPGTKKLRSIFYKPAAHPRSCAFSRCDFFYKNNRIDKIEISSPSSGCEVIVKTFQFDYFTIGALKSVVQVDDFNINETFFAYDSSGRVGKIFRNGRYKNESVYRFSETMIKYDSMGNINELTSQPSYSNTISERISYSYDTSINPFKGVYIPQNFLSVFGWHETHAFFLSSNVVSMTTRFIESNAALQSLPYMVNSNGGRLDQFYYFDQFGSTIYYQ